MALRFFLVAKNYSKPLNLKKWSNKIILYDLKDNNKYKVKIDISLANEEQVKVKIDQIDIRRKKLPLYEQNYNVVDGKVIEEFEIEINQTDFDKLLISFIGNNNSEVILNKIYINGKEDIVNYKYLPNNVMRLIKTLKFNNISITERLSMYKSGFILYLQHPIVGNGAKTFYNMYKKTREYSYTTWEVHSFYMDILMDYGLIGITICISIIGITIYNFTKRKNKTNILSLSIFFSWLMVAIHTIVDFDLAYMLTLANFYIMIALISEEDRNFTKNTKIVEYLVSIVMLAVVVINIYKLPGEKLFREGKYKEAMKYIPFYASNTEKYINSLEDNTGINSDAKKNVLIKLLQNEQGRNQYWNIISLHNISIDLIRNNNINEGIEGLETIVSLLEKDVIIAKYDIKRKDMWNKFSEDLKKEIQELSIKYETDNLKKLNERVQKSE